MKLKYVFSVTTAIGLIALVLTMSKQLNADKLKAGTVKEVGGIELVWIPSGEFMMGMLSSKEKGAKPIHKVQINGFWMSKYEVTQKSYQKLVGKNNGYQGDHYKENPNYPVMTTFYNAIEFCNKLSVSTGREPYYNIDKEMKDPANQNRHDPFRWLITVRKEANGFRLPYEAEWEYACRAGTTTKYYWGESENPSVIDQYAVYDKECHIKGSYYIVHNSRQTELKYRQVGTKKPNLWGLYDMIGNVEEWCFDWYSEEYYSSSPINNPQGPQSVSDPNRVVRGGDYNFSPNSDVWCFGGCSGCRNGKWGIGDGGIRIVLVDK